MSYCMKCGGELKGGPSCPSCGEPSMGSAIAEQAAPTWKLVQSQGSVTLAESESEYAVYDQQVTFGRWPKTPEGLRLATESLGAHAQSVVHGLAYEATGYQDPARLGLPTDPVLKSQTYASPMSYIGSSRRIVAWARGLAQRNPGIAVVGWTAAVLAIVIMW